MSIKVKGFLKDVGGASRVTEARHAAIRNASAVPDPKDHIREVADLLHPDPMPLRVTEIRQTSPYSKTFRFVSENGHLPVFQCGQYASFRLKIGQSELTRPYTISSAPYEARGENPFFEITVRRNRPYFVPDWLFENVKVGDVVEGALPFGTFYWEPLRDSRDIVALAGGVGITPFASMAREVAHGTLDMDLTILYGSVSSDDITLKEELAALEGEHVRVVHVLSGDEPDWQGEKGFLTAELIRKYSAPDTTYFICGPQVMYRFLHGELAKLDIPKRRVRFEVFGQAKDITTFPGYPMECRDRTYQLTVVRGLREDVIPAKATESLVVALERAGIRIETGCRSGECGFCRTKVLSGSVYICPENDGRRGADRDFNYVHACAAYPTGDVKIKIPIV